MAELRQLFPGGPGEEKPLLCLRCANEPTSVRKFRVAPRASYVPLDRLPARFRAGRSSWPKTQFYSTMRLFGMSGIW
jgi:hypothetical protein